MCKRNCLPWVIVGVISVLVITIFSIAGGIIGYGVGKPRLGSGITTSWKSIGPTNTQMTGLKVISIKDTYPPCYIVMLITNGGQLLSSGVIQSHVQEWRWTDISNEISWTNFPLAALGQDCQPWMEQEGKQYQIDQNGRWHLVENGVDSPFLNPLENLAETNQDYSGHLAWVTPPGEISQMQTVTILWAEDTQTLVFAMLKEKDGLWFLNMHEGAYEWMGIAGYTMIGLVGGFFLAVLICIMIIIYLVVYMRRKQPGKT